MESSTNLDNMFDTLQDFTNELDDNPIIEKEKCCDNITNHKIDNGVIICSGCNNIISNIIECPEWRYYSFDDSKHTNPTRCGMPVNVLLPQASIGSIISYNNNSGNAKPI